MMTTQSFPLEKIFGSRTRVKLITLFATGIKRPYFVREIARTVDERLNAVRRELEILEKIGLVTAYEERRRKYYLVNENFYLFDELASIMRKAGPGMDDVMFKHVGQLGDVKYVCVSGYFTGVEHAPTDLFIVGSVNERRLELFAKRIESQLGREISYTPMELEEYQYRLNFNDMFLRQLFASPYKEILNKLPGSLSPEDALKTSSTNIVRDSA